jgi:hypothetical protein
MQLSDRAKQLIPKARIVSFSSWEHLYPQEAIALFQQADDEGRYLSDRDIELAISLVPQLRENLATVKSLRDNVTQIVAQAREEVLRQYPNILAPGGELYPPARAEACWRDFWHFLRCITYGIGGISTEFTSTEGLKYMEQLYQELKVPLGAMVLGLEQLKKFSIEYTQQEELAPYFDHLINNLRKFQA